MNETSKREHLIELAKKAAERFGWINADSFIDSCDCDELEEFILSAGVGS